VADRRVEGIVLKALAGAGIRLTSDARQTVQRRVRAAPTPAVAGESDTERSDAELDPSLRDLALRNTEIVAARMREVREELGVKTFNLEVTQTAILGLCPIWPFC
jgi:hypothetical protein